SDAPVRGVAAARQVDRERGALAELGSDVDRTADVADNAVHEREPEAGADADALGGEEGIEHLLEHVPGDAAAAVAHAQHEILARREAADGCRARRLAAPHLPPAPTHAALRH